jgi:hypothetical protein
LSANPEKIIKKVGITLAKAGKLNRDTMKRSFNLLTIILLVFLIGFFLEKTIDSYKFSNYTSLEETFEIISELFSVFVALSIFGITWAVGQNSSIPSIQKMKTHRLCSLLDFTSIFNSWNEFFILSTLDSHVNVPCIYCFFRNI